jgi:hypothetical protein
VALALREKTWQLGCTTGHGQRPRERTVAARHHVRVLQEVAQATQRFVWPATAPVLCCYAAGHAGFWLHRFVQVHGSTNTVVDSTVLSSPLALLLLLSSATGQWPSFTISKGEPTMQVQEIMSTDGQEARRRDSVDDTQQPQPSAQSQQESALLKLQQEFHQLLQECLDCRREIAPHWQFCAHCGVRLATHCPGCGNPLPPAGAAACLRCGLALPSVARLSQGERTD